VLDESEEEPDDEPELDDVEAAAVEALEPERESVR
jgi:hypothetical protein